MPDSPKPSELQTVRPEVPPKAEIQKAALEAAEKLAEQDPKTLLSIFLAKSTTSFGPDPETARIIAESEMHGEDCKLKGYQATLQNRDQQNQRDHVFRLKRLQHETAMQIIVLVAAVCGSGVGLYLVVEGHTGVGGNVLVASVMTILYVLGGRSPLLKGKD